MLEALMQIQQPAGAVISVATTLLWVLALQITLASLRRRQKPRILIERGPGRGLDAVCVITNLASGPLSIGAIQSRVTHTDDSVSRRLLRAGDFSQVSAVRSSQPQGGEGFHVLRSGETIHVGTLRQHAVFATGKDGNERDGGDIRGVEVTLIAQFGTSERFVGASRSFEAGEPSSHEGERRSRITGGRRGDRGQGERTRQLRSRRDRRHLAHLFAEEARL